MRQNGLEKRKRNSSLKEQVKAWNIFLKSFGDLLPGGIGLYEISDQVRPLYLSSGVIQMAYGFGEEFYKKAKENVKAVMPEKDYDKLHGELKEAIEHGKVMDCTLRYRMTPKKKGWAWVRGKIITKNRKKSLFIALILDVTKQKEIENELQVQNERYRILEETSDEILFEIRVDKDIMTYSYKEMNGSLIRRRVSHYSRSLLESPLVHPDYMEVFRRHLELAQSQRMEGQLEYLSKISGHGYEWHRVCYNSIADESGNVTRVIGRIKNVHDEVLRRQTEKDEFTFGMHSESGVQQRIRSGLENAELDDTHSLAIVAINHFKKRNKQNGVAWGDAAMRRLLGIMQQLIGGQGIFGRLPDGEVLVYFKNISENKLDEIMENIIVEIEKADNEVADLNLTCSIGAVMMAGVADYASFYQGAEEALHIAKITKDERYIRV